MPGNQCRFGRKSPGRPMKPRTLCGRSDYGSFMPSRPTDDEPIVLEMDEMEALRLVDYLGMSQEEAAIRMGVSRGTVWRCVDSGRRKLVAMVEEGRPLKVRDDAPRIDD
ncbi:MAG: DUF134 domain-containing protein [Euryarchaeota archaeon]|nr:DUF134 domain-containing protein [Euryarchaeota archaeon]